MKTTAIILFFMPFLLLADEILTTDLFKNSSWRAVNTSEYAKIENQVMTLRDDRRYLSRSVSKVFNRGSRFRVQVEARAAGKIKIGIFSYGEKIAQLWSEEQSLNDSFTVYEYECEIPERARQVVPVVQGAGEYRKVVLTHLFDPEYQLLADPPYQMSSQLPQPVTFSLYHQGKVVADAQLIEIGQEAFHRQSGATAYAWIDKADSSQFDATAKYIQLEKALNILYLGDSLTHFDLGHNHVDKVAYFLNKYNPGKATAFNYACGGDDIQRVVKRLEGDSSGKYGQRYQDLWSRSYDWVFVFLGHNDTKASSAKQFKETVIPPELQRELYEKLLHILKSKDIKRIILISSTSSNSELCHENSAKTERIHNRFGDPEHLEAFNKVLKELAQKHSCEYLDVYEPMKSLPDKAKLLNPKDGVHLTDAGHDFIAIETLKYLQSK